MTRSDRRGALCLTAGLGWTLGGCASLVAARVDPPPEEYRLTPDPRFPADLPRRGWVLIVAEPTAEGVLDTNRIAVMAEGRVDRLAGVTWSDRPAAMLQSAIVQAFQGSGRLRAAGTDREDLPGRYLLQSTLNAFQLQPEDGGYAADVRLHARLLGLPLREVAGARDFQYRVPAAAASNVAAVDAFDDAVSELLADLVGWTLRTGRARG